MSKEKEVTSQGEESQLDRVEGSTPEKGSRDVLLARETFIISLEGQEHFIRAGVTHARRGAAVVKARPEAWVEVPVAFDIEQTTARPGEKRAR